MIMLRVLVKDLNLCDLCLLDLISYTLCKPGVSFLFYCTNHTYLMWSKCFANSFRKTTSYARHANSSLSMRMAQERFHSTGASHSFWKNGMILGAGALGLSCAYLTHKTFALSQDPVCFNWSFEFNI